MKRVISVYLPHWPTDRRRKQHGLPICETPFVLLTREGQRRIVTHADRIARNLGIRNGMAVAQAQALVANLHMEEADTKADMKGLEQLAHWGLKHYSPVIATDSDGLMIDATGCAHLFGGEQAMLSQLLGKLESSGIDAKAAMAPTYGAAHAIARFKRGKLHIIANDESESALRPLPVEALRLSDVAIQKFRKLGLDTIADLINMPRAPLTLRFGTEIGRRIDQALGHAFEVFEPCMPPEMLVERQNFAEPISTPEVISYYITRLCEAVCRNLEERSLGVRSLDLIFTRVDNSLQSLRIGLAQPARDAVRLVRLMTDKLETIDPGFGIETMHLTASWTEPLFLKQAQLTEHGRQAHTIISLIDTLSNRLGDGHVYKLASVESDIPERSITPVAPITALSDIPLPSHWPRPARLFARPEPIETIAMLPDYPPVSFIWRGKRHRVRAADGPERIFGEWWKCDNEIEAVRDYFQLENEQGERFWVFRAGDGVLPGSGSQKWFVHGAFT